jgi:hypothetical protein
MSDKPISPLRQRMIDDMTARRFKEKVQKDYVRHVRTFAAFLGRSRTRPRARTFADINCIWPSSRSARGPSTPPSPRSASQRQA